MGNLVTFAERFFEKDFTQMPLTEVDSLILCNLSYYEYENSIFEKNKFEETVQLYLQERPEGEIKGLVSVEKDKKLRQILVRGGRHGNLRAGGFVGILDTESDKQFSAITFCLGNGKYYIAFRGTDGTLTGWREDFNLSFTKEIPAQEEAVSYAKKIMDCIAGEFYLGGHSKGGNLAVYCASMLTEEYQNRIIGVFNHDGPGFLKEFYQQEGYQKIRHKLQKTVPESSVIGMLLEEDDHYQVVKSTENGLMQHDPFSWCVEMERFVKVKDVDHISLYTSLALRKWLEQLDMEERERIVNTVFDVIADTGIREFEELTEQKRKRIRLLLESMRSVKSEDRKLVVQAIGNLFSLSIEEIQEAIKIESIAYLEQYFREHIPENIQNIIPEKIQERIQNKIIKIKTNTEYKKEME